MPNDMFQVIQALIFNFTEGNLVLQSLEYVTTFPFIHFPTPFFSSSLLPLPLQG